MEHDKEGWRICPLIGNLDIKLLTMVSSSNKSGKRGSSVRKEFDFFFPRLIFLYCLVLSQKA